MMSDYILIDDLRAQAKQRGEATALVFEGRETSYRELDERASQVAQSLLKEGIEPHARVAFLGKNSDSYFELLLGAQKTRSVIVGVN